MALGIYEWRSSGGGPLDENGVPGEGRGWNVLSTRDEDRKEREERRNKVLLKVPAHPKHFELKAPYNEIWSTNPRTRSTARRHDRNNDEKTSSPAISKKRKEKESLLSFHFKLHYI